MTASFREGDRVLVTAVGPRGRTGKGVIVSIDPVYFRDGEERLVYLVEFDGRFEDTPPDWKTVRIVVGDGEISHEG